MSAAKATVTPSTTSTCLSATPRGAQSAPRLRSRRLRASMAAASTAMPRPSQNGRKAGPGPSGLV